MARPFINDEVYYTVYTLEYPIYDDNPAPKENSRDVYAEVIKDHQNGKYHIKLTEPPYSEEKEVDGKYLLKKNN